MIGSIVQSIAGIGSAVAGSMIGGGAINAANNQQARGFDAANQAARQAYGVQNSLYSPYAQRGNAAGDAMNALLGLGGATYATPQFEAERQQADDAWAANAIATIRSQVKKGEARRSRQALEATAGKSPTEQLAAMRAVLGSRGLSMLSGLEASRPLPQPNLAPAAGGASAAGAQQAQEDAFQRFRDSTGYQFRVNEGRKDIEQQFAGRGALQSGAALKALEGYRQNMASNEFGNYFGMLGGQQQAGLQGAGLLGNAAQNFGNIFGNNAAQAAQNSANATVAQGAIKQNALGQIAQAVGGMGSSFGGGNGLASLLGGSNGAASLSSRLPTAQIPLGWGG